MFLFFIAVYLVIALPVLMLIWAMLVVAKRDNQKRGYDLLEDRISFFE
jgi:phosphate starvation-inducible membrane PsiE